jgi:hypothetical protein
MRPGRRWEAGQSLHEIGRAFDKPLCVRSVLLPRGGIPPTARRRSRLALTLAEREDLSRGIASDSPLPAQKQSIINIPATIHLMATHVRSRSEPGYMKAINKVIDKKNAMRSLPSNEETTERKAESATVELEVTDELDGARSATRAHCRPNPHG